MTVAVLCPPPLSRSSRSRLVMFSTSMIASSTTAPSAITRPARVIVLMVAPRQYSTSIVATSDSGIVSRLISATRHSNRNSPQDDHDQDEAEHERLGEVGDRQLDEVGLLEHPRVELDPGQAGLQILQAWSTPAVICRLLAHGSFSTTSSRPAGR